MKIFGHKFFGITQGEVLVALIVMSLVILASKNITENKINYAKRVRTYAAWQNLSNIASSVVSDGIQVEDEYKYKMISPVYKTAENASYLPDILDVNSMPSVHIYGGFYDKLIEHFNVLENQSGPTFNCNGCGGAGFFETIKPTLYLSNGMTLFISSESYSFARTNVALNNSMVTTNFRNTLKCLNGLPAASSGGCNRLAEINTFCLPLEVDSKVPPVAPGSTTFSGNTTTYFKNIAECPWCSNMGTAVSRYPAVPIFEYFHVLFKSLRYSDSCRAKSEAFLNESFSRFLAGSYYVVFVDTDGPRSGSNTLNDDVMEFYVLLNGEVLPISPKMRVGDFLLSNLYRTSETGANIGVRTLQVSGISLPASMCNYVVGTTPSYYSNNFVPIRNYCPVCADCPTPCTDCPNASNCCDRACCPNQSVACSANNVCDYVPIRANVSIRGRGQN